MSITITQRCDRCGEERSLNVGYHGGRDTIRQAALAGGWRDVQEFKHLCDKCIRKALEPDDDPAARRWSPLSTRAAGTES